jgi:hypothetical protein
MSLFAASSLAQHTSVALVRGLRVSGKVLLKWINNRSPELVEG